MAAAAALLDEVLDRQLVRGTGLGDITRASNQSVLGVAERLTSSGVAKPLWAALVVPILVVGLGIAVRISADGREPFAVSIVGITGCLVSPVSWSHHWVWFVPWIAGLAAAPLGSRARAAAVFFTAYLVIINLVTQGMIHRFTVFRVPVQSSYPLAAVVAALFVLASIRARATGDEL